MTAVLAEPAAQPVNPLDLGREASAAAAAARRAALTEEVVWFHLGMGWSRRATAQRLGCHRDTVARLLAEYGHMTPRERRAVTPVAMRKYPYREPGSEEWHAARRRLAWRRGRERPAV